MALSRSRIQKRSDERRDMVQKNLKLPKKTAKALEWYASISGKGQGAIIMEALELWEQAQGIAMPAGDPEE